MCVRVLILSAAGYYLNSKIDSFYVEVKCLDSLRNRSVTDRLNTAGGRQRFDPCCVSSRVREKPLFCVCFCVCVFRLWADRSSGSESRLRLHRLCSVRDDAHHGSGGQTLIFVVFVSRQRRQICVFADLTLTAHPSKLL